MNPMSHESLDTHKLAPAVALLFFGLALLLTSSDLYWGESSLFAARSWYLGVANPPGYPLFLMLLYPFQKLCLGDIIARSNMLGNLIYAVASGVFFTLMTRISRSQIIAFSVTCILFLSGPVLQSIAAVEVYSLNILFFSALVLLLTRELSPRKTCFIFFLCGLMFTHHLTLVLTLPGILLLVGWNSRWTWKNTGIYLFFLILGFSPLLYPVIRESVIPLQTWGEADTVSGFVNLVTANEESSASFLAGISSLSGILSRGKHILFSIIGIIGWAGILFVLAGVFSIFRRNRPLSVFLMPTILLFSAAVVTYQSNEALSFFIPGIIITIIFMGAGLRAFSEIISRRMSFSDEMTRLTVTLVCLGFCVIPLSKINQFRSADVHFPRCLASELSDRSSNSSVIVTHRSDISFLLSYMRDIEYRHNNPVIFQHLLSFKWYYRELSDTWPNLVQKEILNMPFEDSYPWNSAVTASLIRYSSQNREIWITDPEILDDIQSAGLKTLYLRPEAFFSRIQFEPRESPDWQMSDLPVRFTGNLDGISRDALAGHFMIRSRFYQLAGDSENAGLAYKEALRLKTSNE